MTENEAIKILQGAIKKPNTQDGYLGQAVTMAIQALEEIQQYRAIGTIEEFKDLKEKNTPKKIKYECYCGFKDSICPVCERGIDNEDKYCKRCGQKLDWQ